MGMILTRPQSRQRKTALTKRQEVTYMKRPSFLVMGILFAACAETAKPAPTLQQSPLAQE